MPDDGSYIDELQQQYGSTFATMPRTLKAALLVKLAENLLSTEIKMAGYAVAEHEMNALQPIADNIYRRVTIGEQLGLAEAIVNQLKCRG
ncbi:MAG: hypothetical protein KME30_26965 [Iphinoe sp. HA4291-MV1]|jgi:hypothetical protein|nr:hypothetical protein [Iphinoe sp. HA4291-MV1]